MSVTKKEQRDKTTQGGILEDPGHKSSALCLGVSQTLDAKSQVPSAWLIKRSQISALPPGSWREHSTRNKAAGNVIQASLDS